MVRLAVNRLLLLLLPLAGTAATPHAVRNNGGERRRAEESPSPVTPSAACVAAFAAACPNERGQGLACHTCFLSHEKALEAAGCGSTLGAIEGLCSISPPPGPPGPPGPPDPEGGGGSTGKNTWAIQDPQPFYEFMRQYFPVQTNVVSDFPKCFTDEDPNDNADGCHCWAKMCIDAPSNAGSTCSGPAPTFFQMHAVNAYKRPSGNRTVVSFEQDWEAALGALLSPFACAMRCGVLLSTPIQ